MEDRRQPPTPMWLKFAIVFVFAFLLGEVLGTATTIEVDFGGYQKAAEKAGYDKGYEEGKVEGIRLYSGLPRLPHDGGAFVKVACLEFQRLCLLKEVGETDGSEIVMSFKNSEPWVWRTVTHAPVGSMVFLNTGTK